eukprot:gene17100-biopygen6815
MSGLNSDTRDGVGGLGSHCQLQRWCVLALLLCSQRVPRRGPRRRGDAWVPPQHCGKGNDRKQAWLDV